MSHLIPVKRHDKNGRLVTKHVKPQTAATTPPSIPAPVSSPVIFQGGITIPRSVESIQDIWDSNAISRTTCTLDDFDQGAVREVNDLLGRAREEGYVMGMSVAVGEALDLMAEHEIPKGLHNLAVFGPVVLPHGNINATPYITALQELNAPREIDYYLDATEEELESAKALIELTVRADMEVGKAIVRSSFEDEGEPLEYYELRDPELTNFIIKNPKTVDDVMDILLKENGPVPVDIIKERLAHGEKILRDGVL